MKKAAVFRIWEHVLIAALVSVVWVSSPAAREYPFLYRGVRPLAMGGAFTAVADDEHAMIFNPAGLADISICSVTEDSKKNAYDFTLSPLSSAL